MLQNSETFVGKGQLKYNPFELVALKKKNERKKTIANVEKRQERNMVETTPRSFHVLV